MKPSQIMKDKAQSDKVKKANEKFAAAAFNEKVLKSDKGGSNEGDKEPTGFVSFEGEQPKFKDYMYVEFKVQMETQKGKKTKEGFEDTISGGIAFLRESMSEGKSNFSIVPKMKSNTSSKVIKSWKDFPKTNMDGRAHMPRLRTVMHSRLLRGIRTPKPSRVS